MSVVVSGALFDRAPGPSPTTYTVEFIVDDGVQCKEVHHALRVDIGSLLNYSAVVQSLHRQSPSSFRLLSSDHVVQRMWQRVWQAGDAAPPAAMITDLFTPESLQVCACVTERRIYTHSS